MGMVLGYTDSGEDRNGLHRDRLRIVLLYAGLQEGIGMDCTRRL